MSEDFVLTEGLQAYHNDVKRSMVGGRRSVVTDTIAGHNDLVGGQLHNIVVSGMDPSTVIDPRTMEFEFENSGTGCFFKNNLGRLLVKRLEVMIGGTKIYQNDHESMFNIFHDKWKSEAELKKWHGLELRANRHASIGLVLQFQIPPQMLKNQRKVW